jgi:CRP-like cAMP-binding protein
MTANTLSSISTINKLKEHNKINDSMLVCINSLKLEDLIAIKLELSSKNINNRLYGFDLWRRTSYIVRDGLLKYSLSVAKSKKDAARFLGITYAEYMKHLKDFKTRDYFEND